MFDVVRLDEEIEIFSGIAVTIKLSAPLISSHSTWIKLEPTAVTTKFWGEAFAEIKSETFFNDW